MTVSSQVSEVSYDTDGVATAYPVPFYFLANSHLRVWLLEPISGTETDLVLGSDYGVTGAGNTAGGTVNTYTAWPMGLKLGIQRIVPITQETSYQPNDPFPAKSHERALDKLTMLAQQFESWLGTIPGAISRVIHFPIEIPRRSGRLPVASARARKALIFDDNGNVTVGTDDYEDQAENAAESAAAAAASAAEAEADRQEVERIANEFGDLETAVDRAEAAADAAEEDATRSEVAADRAETAADAAALNGGIFPDISAGIAGTASGSYFTVPSAEIDGYLDLYLNNAGVADYIDTYPNKEAVQAALVGLAQKVSYARYPLTTFGEAALDLDLDTTGNPAGGNDVLEDHEIRLTNVELAGGVEFRVPLSVWGEAARSVVIDPQGNIAGGEDVQEAHEVRLTSLENGGGGGGGSRVIIGHISVGQSNARGAGNPVPFPMTATAVYVRQAFMPGGPGMNVALGTGAAGSYEPINPADFQSFLPLRSVQLSASNSTTLLEGIGWAQAQLEESQGQEHERLYWTTAQGGVSLAARSPGTVPYDNMLAALDRSVTIAQTTGKSYIVESLHSNDGEADTATANFDLELIDVYAEQLTADIKAATGQTFDPPIILSQPSSFFGSVEGVLGIYRAARNHPRMHLATAGYHLPYWSDLLHYDSAGHPMNGEYHLRVLRALRAGRIWRPVMPKFIKWDGGTGLDVWFHVPEPPLVIDLTAPHHGDYGFVLRADGANQTIASIEQMGPDHIHFEAAAPLGANRSLQYAMRGYQSSPRQPGDGPMGALRDSCDTPSMFDSSHTLWNWGVHFVESF